MATISIPRSTFDLLDEETMVCVFCDTATDMPYCGSCNEYKGLMTIAQWESYTGEVWE
jgi:hypothetical protein